MLKYTADSTRSMEWAPKWRGGGRRGARRGGRTAVGAMGSRVPVVGSFKGSLLSKKHLLLIREPLFQWMSRGNAAGDSLCLSASVRSAVGDAASGAAPAGAQGVVE